jgi:regulator of protease activity HflC (stomatin/prohibitin superfamily)
MPVWASWPTARIWAFKRDQLKSCFRRRTVWILLALITFGLMVAILLGAGQVFLAKGAAIRNRKEEVPLFGGMVKLILWEANEGLLLLKDKRISRVIYGPRDGGGLKFIYPILGEELRVRVPLTLKLTQFEDHRVLTRESTRLFMKVALWWRVADLEKYYYSIDREVHVLSDQLAHRQPLAKTHDPRKAQQEAAEAWISTLAESCVRKLVSQTTTALLVSKHATSYLHVSDRHSQAPAGQPMAPPGLPGLRPSQATHDGAPQGVGTPDVLAGQIHRMLGPKVADYGLEIDRVEIQEVRLPEDIQEAVDRVFKATLLPAQTEQEARARQIDLQAAASVLGVETVALTEVMKNFKGSQFIGGLPRFIEALFTKAAESHREEPPVGKLEPPVGRLEPALGKLEPSPQAVGIPYAESVPAPKPQCPKCGGELRATVGPQGGEQRVECAACGAAFRSGRRTGPGR